MSSAGRRKARMLAMNPAARRAGGDRRRNNRRGEGARLRVELIDAGCELLAETGNASQLSIRGVAARAGVAATSVYLHFADLDELKVAVAERGFDGLAAARQAAVAGLDDPCAVLIARCLAYCHFGLSHPGQYRLMFGAALPAPVFTSFYNATHSASRGAYESMTDAIARCQRAGEGSDDVDPTLLAAILWPALHGQVLLRLDRPDFPRPPLADVVTTTVHRLVGIGRGAAEGSAPSVHRDRR